MAEPMTDVALTLVVIGLLAEAGDDWRWDPDGATPYTADDVGLFYGAVGKEPDRAVGVRVYSTTDDRLNHVRWRRVQLHHRGARGRPDGADELAGESFPVLQGLSRVEGIVDASRQSMAPLGADGNGREERTDNYIIILDNPEATS